MADLQNLKDRKDRQDLEARTPCGEAAGAAALQCDRAIFTSLPSRTGEGYRLVAWSSGVRPEERQELTRRAPSHGSLAAESGSARGLLLFHLQSTGRAAWGFVRVSGTEHTRRGGGRVWTDFLLCDAADAQAQGRHPADLRTALLVQPAPKLPLGTSALECVAVVDRVAAPPSASDAPSIARVAGVASLLVGGRACVIATAGDPADVLDDALRMLPASVRGGIDACAGLRFSPARGVKATLAAGIDSDTIRATRGQGVECIDLAKVRVVEGPLQPWIALMTRWWSEERGEDAARLADRMDPGWTMEQVLRVAAVCEAIDRGEERSEELAGMFAGRSAA